MASAVVLGFNIHGLAVARALSEAGITVHALTPSLHLATSSTQRATVHLRHDVNSERLIDILLDFSTTVLRREQSVLFPTSDKMVIALATHWDKLEGKYLLSWSACRDLILNLIKKENLPALCKRNNVRHPASITITDASTAQLAYRQLSPPIIVKPSRPMSSFKTLLVDSAESLERLALEYPNDLPFVAQTYIDGSDDSLYFCALYFRNGQRLCAFTGRKLLANPPGLGQGTIMAGEDIPELVGLSDQFLQNMQLTGPVALEFKRDVSGRYWLIEPNVGRTEYCVDLVIQSGINLPLLEYNEAIGEAPGSKSLQATKKRIWFDTDKDPFCYFRYCKQFRTFKPYGKSPVFPYLFHRDPRPLFSATWKLFRRSVRMRG